MEFIPFTAEALAAVAEALARLGDDTKAAAIIGRDREAEDALAADLREHGWPDAYVGDEIIDLGDRATPPPVRVRRSRDSGWLPADDVLREGEGILR